MFCQACPYNHFLKYALLTKILPIYCVLGATGVNIFGIKHEFTKHLKESWGLHFSIKYICAYFVYKYIAKIVQMFLVVIYRHL